MKAVGDGLLDPVILDGDLLDGLSNATKGNLSKHMDNLSDYQVTRLYQIISKNIDHLETTQDIKLFESPAQKRGAIILIGQQSENLGQIVEILEQQVAHDNLRSELRQKQDIISKAKVAAMSDIVKFVAKPDTKKTENKQSDLSSTPQPPVDVVSGLFSAGARAAGKMKEAAVQAIPSVDITGSLERVKRAGGAVASSVSNAATRTKDFVVEQTKPKEIQPPLSALEKAFLPPDQKKTLGIDFSTAGSTLSSAAKYLAAQASVIAKTDEIPVVIPPKQVYSETDEYKEALNALKLTGEKAVKEMDRLDILDNLLTPEKIPNLNDDDLKFLYESTAAVISLNVNQDGQFYGINIPEELSTSIEGKVSLTREKMIEDLNLALSTRKNLEENLSIPDIISAKAERAETISAYFSAMKNSFELDAQKHGEALNSNLSSELKGLKDTIDEKNRQHKVKDFTCVILDEIHDSKDTVSDSYTKLKRYLDTDRTDQLQQTLGKKADTIKVMTPTQLDQLKIELGDSLSKTPEPISQYIVDVRIAANNPNKSKAIKEITELTKTFTTDTITDEKKVAAEKMKEAAKAAMKEAGKAKNPKTYSWRQKIKSWRGKSDAQKIDTAFEAAFPKPKTKTRVQYMKECVIVSAPNAIRGVINKMTQSVSGRE